MSNSHRKLLIATNNPGKVRELADLCAELPLELCSLSGYRGIEVIDETGLTFDENARLKASGYARQTGLLALADDSGLEVAALGNRPGVLSARYGGPDTNFAEKMAKLLDELTATGDESRRARFVCSMAVAAPDGNILFASEGICNGEIGREALGSGGFGYDPIFVPHGFEMTFGELPEAVKRQISHRFRAFEQIIPLLRDFTAV